MTKLIVVLAATVLLSGTARLLGASRKFAVVLALLPAAIMQILFVASGVLVRNTEGEIVPAWQMVVGGILIPSTLAVVVAILVKKKTAEPISHSERP